MNQQETFEFSEYLKKKYLYGKSEEFSNIMDSGLNFNDQEMEGEEENGEDFVKGGATTFPFIKNLFSNMLFSNKDDFSDGSSEGSEKTGNSNEKSKKKSKRRK